MIKEDLTVAVNTIDAKMLAKMFLAGAKNLESKKEWINELNVFPVPDGDTGTNMTLTIMSAAKDVAAMNANNDLDMKSLAKAISSGSLRGARGNSGVILSQLFRGFTKAIRDYDTIDIPLLAEACEKGKTYGYRLAQNGAPNRALKTSYKELLGAVESCSDKALKRAIRTTVEEKSRYVAERIARTESARAWYQGFLKDTIDDPDVVAYRWVESTRHPTEDICDEYAKVDAYGLGPGIFPKDKAPELPAHPHCLCHYEKVYASELERIQGLASGKIEYSDNHVTVVREHNIAYNDDEGLEKLFNKFCEDHQGDNIEHALVITMDGEVYHCIG